MAKKTNMFQGKTILITGGTGYLGRSLVTEILKKGPHSVRVFSRDEVKHHHLQELFKHNNKIRHLLGDIRDRERLIRATRQADIVIHAAALKRLDLLEYNVEESIKTNIIGTLNVVDACLHNRVQKAVFISSDKACAPVNTYGACKFVSERIFSESNYSKGDIKTVFTTVRYGNVLESTGSVIPFFTEKIMQGESIPLTDSRMTRFIISPKQAVNLIFDALRYGVGGEVFIPKLPSFKVTDLIEILTERYQANSKIKKIGLRPGEKIHELMINSAEVPRTYDFKNLYVISSCIQAQSGKTRPAYMRQGKLLDEKVMEQYSSRDAVISKKEVIKLFNSLGLLR